MTDKPKELSLEDIIQLANRIGLEFADRRQQAERLELMRTPVRSKIMNELAQGDPKASESRLKRLAEGSDAYVSLLEEIVVARAEAERLRIRYESYRSLFEARRTLMSYKKAELWAL